MKCPQCDFDLVYMGTTCPNPGCTWVHGKKMPNTEKQEAKTIRPNYYRQRVKARVIESDGLPVMEARASTEVEIECQDLIEALGLTWNEGNVLKYLFRAGKKTIGQKGEELKKVVTYATFAQTEDEGKSK